MMYKVVTADLKADKRIEQTVEAKSVFDAIDIAADTIDNPEETVLIESYPIL